MGPAAARIAFCAAWLGAACSSGAAPLAASVAVERSLYDAREQLPSTSFVLNREFGALDGGSLGASAIDSSGGWEASLRHLSGGLSYRGLSQFGMPIETRTDLKLERFEFAFDPLGTVSIGRGDVGLAVALAHQRIDRRIRASIFSSALAEVLSSSEVGLRARAAMPLSIGAWPAEIALRLEGWRPWQQRLSVDTGGVYDAFRLEPAPRNSWRIDAGLTLRLNGAMTMRAALGASWLRFGNSDAAPIYRSGLPAGIASYPGSRQRLRTIEVQWQWSFDESLR